jgi:copper transport protein
MRKAIAALVGTLAVLAAIVNTGSPARAHAALERSEPANGAVLPASPALVLLQFSEPVEVGLADIRLVGSQGVVLEEPTLESPTRSTITFAIPVLPEGSYAVIIRVVSAVDGHSTSASVSFVIGEASGPLRGVAAGTAEGPPRFVQALGKLTTFLSLTAVWAVALGALLSNTQVWNLARKWRLTILGVLVGATAIAFALQAWTAAGTIGRIGSGPIRDVLDTRFGRIWVFRFGATVLAAVELVYLWRTSRRLVAIVLLPTTLALCLTVSLNSHLAAHQGRGILPELTGWLHLAASTAWIGGLTALALRARRTGSTATSELGRFTRVAVPSVVAVAATGLLSWLWLTSSWDQLWQTGYGRLVLVKVALFGPMLVLGALHFVAGRGKSLRMPRYLARPAVTLAAESILGLSVLAVAALLSSTPPSGEAIGSGSAQGVTARAQNGSVSGMLRAEPGTAGNNDLSLQIEGTEVSSVTLTVTLPGAGLEPENLTITSGQSGTFSALGILLPVSGSWEVVATVIPTTGVQRELRFSLDIP